MRSKFYLICALSSVSIVTGCADKLPEVCKGVNGLGIGINRDKAINDGEFVERAYQAVLQRDSDPAGLVLHCQMLKEGKITRAELIESFATNPEHNNLKVKP